MNPAHELLPDPQAVTTLVERLVQSQWPTSEHERSAWFQKHGLDIENPRQAGNEAGADVFLGHGPRRWASPWFGWHAFGGEFVGVNWFLWAGESWDAVRAAALQLRGRFCEIAGQPVEEIVAEDAAGGFTAFWHVGGHTVDMYLHGGHDGDQAHGSDVAVQLHVDHTARSDRAAKTMASRAGPA